MSAVLTLKKSLGLKHNFQDNVEIHNLILDGLQKKVVTLVADVIGLTPADIVTILPISTKQFNRYENNEQLSIQLSEHIIAIAEIALIQNTVFRSKNLFKEWLYEPNIALSGKSPYELMQTIPGCKLIRDLIQRVAHGVYS